MFLTHLDFYHQPYIVPNVKAVEDNFNVFVDNEERELLKKILGYAFYKEMDEALAILPDEFNPNGNYLIGNKVISGVNIYESLTDHQNVILPENDVVNWLLFEEGNKWLILKKGGEYLYGGKLLKWIGFSIALRPYIFSRWVESNVVDFTGNGVTESNNENAIAVNPSKIIVSSWNTTSDYVGFLFNVENTLYGFLDSNQTLYDYSFTYLEKRNILGI